MSQRSFVSAVLLVSAFVLALWWYFWGSEPSVPAAPDVTSLQSDATPEARALPAHPATVAYADQTGYVPPDLATATPAEIQAIHDAEVRNSAAAEAPKTYKGIDGKPKAFSYNDARAEAEEVVRDARRQQLMQELKRDPSAFARKYGMASKEAQWILDGTTDFPDRLLLQ